MILENAFLVAEFDDASGRPTSLSRPDGTGDLLEAVWCRYRHGEAWTSEAPEREETDGAAPFRVVSVEAREEAVESVIESDHVRIARRFALPAGSPLLVCEVEIAGCDHETAVTRAAVPCVLFAAGFNDVFEDDEVLYFDGEELPGGRELPPWRALFRGDHAEGILVAARSKYEMSHFQFRERGLEIRPDVMTAYNASVLLPGKPVAFDERPSYRAAFELGPWRRADHERILAAARLREPVDVGNPLAEGEPPGNLEGIVFDACDLAPTPQASDDFSEDSWRRAPLPFCLNGRALYASPNTRPPALTLAPDLDGPHRVFIGIGNGDGIAVRFAGDPLPTYRLCPGGRQDETPFTLRLSGRHEAREVEVGVVEMSGRSLELQRYPNEFGTTVLDYVRFAPLDAEEAAAWQRRENTAPRVSLSGFNDIPDITGIVAGTREAYESNLRDHARCGIRKVYWRIDGQCSDYPSKINTMRYVSAKTHGVYTPVARGYGEFLRKHDALALAVEAARKHDLELYGWMRFNSYMGNVQSDFFKHNPQFHEEWESGYPAGKLCLAFEEVRRHKIDILVEAAQYGLDGLNLGFLRHPPVLMYAPALVEGFTREFGEPPPRDREAKDSTCVRRLPPADERHARWHQYRADFLTGFGRQLKAALKEKGLEHVKISIWVRPNHCLFDGIDMRAWLDEDLCDEVVADDHVGHSFPIDAGWRRMVQEKALLCRGVSGFDIEGARRIIPDAIRKGYDGICTYESDQAVLDSRFIELYHSLRT